ncbi:Fic family protein [Tenacibaculum halocynthiae]|uniref:Fic family protein n=1 Tax=Tenacibaculum halocynthiae TaxID=1254437 RepID=UPI003D6606D5
MYNWQQEDWTQFSYQIDAVEDDLYTFREKIGYMQGVLKTLPEKYHIQTLQDILVAEAIKTSEIEGEYLSRKDVLSSIKNNLGISQKKEKVRDVHAKGIANMITSARETFQEPLTKEMLFEWHVMIFPTATKIAVGQWRQHSEPMQVISGAMGKEKVHFEAPPSERVPKEIEAFITWFNETAPNGKNPIKYAPIRSAIAHLYFETIHPFEDGNGRIGRTVAEKALLQTVDIPLLISLSTTIEAEKNLYYEALKEGQRNNIITNWIKYFVDVVLKSQIESENLINFILQKTKLFDTYKDQLNERQIKVINRMLKEGHKGFEGGMTAKKYISIAKTSKPTATRDLQHLLKTGVFVVSGSGRNTSYLIQFPN